MTNTPALPNMLLITTDQQRYDTCGPRAPAFMRTPHFDHLAREGISFSRAYADCPICVPSRISIMTGKTVFAHGNPWFEPSSRFIDNRTSLPGCLQALGYQTAAIGKMHFEPERTRHGFNEMILPADYYRQMGASGSLLGPMRHGLGQNELYPTMATVPESMTLTSWIAEQCVSYIRDRRDPTTPFFLWCSFSKPHPPLDPPEPYYSMYRGCAIPPPVFGDWSDDAHAPEAFLRFRQKQASYDLLPPEIIREARAAYYGLITQIDFNIGRIFAALQDVGLFRDTLIAYTSDHGEYIGDHHTGGKGFFHEPSAHVPMVLRLPQSWENRQPGTTCDSLVTLADILPTLVGAAGGRAPQDADGQDLCALVQQRLPEPRSFLVGVHAPPGWPSHDLAITDGRWKYIYWAEGPSEQLFDLQEDPQELVNRAGDGQCATIQEDLRNRMIQWLKTHGPRYLHNGALPVKSPAGDTVFERRNGSWPGYHTETHNMDVRH